MVELLPDSHTPSFKDVDYQNDIEKVQRAIIPDISI